MIAPGKTQIKISDVSLIPWLGQKAIRFSVALAVGDRGGDLYMVSQGCLAWRNRFKEIEWSLPVFNTRGSRIRRYAGWVSPRMYVEVQRFLEERFGHRLEWVQRSRREKEILDLNEGEETIDFATSGGPGPSGEELPEMDSGDKPGNKGNDPTTAASIWVEDPFGDEYARE